MGHCDSCAVFYCHTWCWTFREYSSIQFAVYLLSQAEFSEACVQLLLWPNTQLACALFISKSARLGMNVTASNYFVGLNS